MICPINRSRCQSWPTKPADVICSHFHRVGKASPRHSAPSPPNQSNRLWKTVVLEIRQVPSHRVHVLENHIHPDAREGPQKTYKPAGLMCLHLPLSGQLSAGQHAWTSFKNNYPKSTERILENSSSGNHADYGAKEALGKHINAQIVWRTMAPKRVRDKD